MAVGDIAVLQTALLTECHCLSLFMTIDLKILFKFTKLFHYIINIRDN